MIYGLLYEVISLYLGFYIYDPALNTIRLFRGGNPWGWTFCFPQMRWNGEPLTWKNHPGNVLATLGTFGGFLGLEGYHSWNKNHPNQSNQLLCGLIGLIHRQSRTSCVQHPNQTEKIACHWTLKERWEGPVHFKLELPNQWNSQLDHVPTQNRYAKRPKTTIFKILIRISRILWATKALERNITNQLGLTKHLPSSNLHMWPFQWPPGFLYLYLGTPYAGR